jgi:small subunit ribosomal protein S17
LERNKRKTFTGVVKSDKMDKSVTVEVTRLVKHPTYGKYVKRTAKYMVHDPENSCGIGDRVKIGATRPLSKMKRWRLVEIVEKAR